MEPRVPQTSISLRVWLMMGCLALIWGGSFPANRAALAEVGVLTTVAFRVAGASLALWAYVLARGLPVPRGARMLGVFAVLGVFNNVVPFTLIVWGQSHIPSGLAGILNAATAIFTVLLVSLVFPDERLSPRKAVGVALGFAGVSVTIGMSALRALDLTSLGQLAVLGASLSYAVTSAFARVALRGMRAEVSAAGMLSMAALVMVPWAWAVEGPPLMDYHPATWAALAYLALASSALAYILYYGVLTKAGAGNLSLVTLLVAPIAILLGALLFGEALHATAYLGFTLLALGLLVIDGRAVTAARHAFSA